MIQQKSFVLYLKSSYHVIKITFVKNQISRYISSLNSTKSGKQAVRRDDDSMNSRPKDENLLKVIPIRVQTQQTKREKFNQNGVTTTNLRRGGGLTHEMNKKRRAIIRAMKNGLTSKPLSTSVHTIFPIFELIKI